MIIQHHTGQNKGLNNQVGLPTRTLTEAGQTVATTAPCTANKENAFESIARLR